MATVDFPASPNTGDSYTYNGVTYTYDGVKWMASAGAGAAALWKRTGTTLEATTAGDSVALGAGDLGAAKGAFSGDVTAAKDVQMASLNSGPLTGFRNQLINGGFRIWQRGTGPTAPNATGASYLSDRWTVRGTGGSGGTPTVEFSWGPNKEYSMHRYNATGLTSGSYVEQRVEASMVRPMINKQHTVSVYSSHPVAISLYYFDSASVLQTITVEENMDPEGNNRYSYTFTMPNATVAAFGEDTGLIVRFHYNNAASPLADGSYDIWNAQLEPGPVATPFEARPIGTELALCQRYYQKPGELRASLRSSNNADRQVIWGRPVEMRVAPTETATFANGSSVAFNSTAATAIIYAVAGTATSITRTFDYTADAEL